MWRYSHIVLFILALIYMGINLAKSVSINSNNLKAYYDILSNQGSGLFNDGPASNYLRGLEAFHQNNFEEAANFFVQTSPDRKNLSHWYYIQAKGSTPEWDQALDSVDFKNSEEKILFASILFSHRTQLSPDELDKREKIIRQNPEMILVYANHFLSNDQFDQAIHWIELLPNLDSSLPGQITIGRAYFYTRRLADAERIFQKLQKETPSPDVEFWYGKVLFLQGDQEKGISFMKKGAFDSTGKIKNRYLLDLIDAYLSIKDCSEAQKNLALAVGLGAASENPVTVGALKEKISNICP